MTTVREIMSASPVTASPDTPMRDVVDMLYVHDIRHMPIVSDGVVVGVVSDRDLRNLIDPRDVEMVSTNGLLEMQRRPISEAMSTDVIFVDPESSIVKAAYLMVDHGVGSVVVVQPGTKQLVGIVSYVDLLEKFCQMVEAQEDV